MTTDNEQQSADTPTGSPVYHFRSVLPPKPIRPSLGSVTTNTAGTTPPFAQSAAEKAGGGTDLKVSVNLKELEHRRFRETLGQLLRS